MGESKLVLRLILNKEEYEKKMQSVNAATTKFGANINRSLNKGKAGLVSLSSQFGRFGRVVGELIAPIQKVGKAITIAFSSNPIGLIVAAIALLIAAVYSFFTRTQEGGDKLKIIWAGIKGVIDGLLDVLSAVGACIVSIFTGDWDGLKQNLSRVKDEFSEIGNKTQRAIELQRQLIALHAQKYGTVKNFKLETNVDIAKVQNLASLQDQFGEVTLKLTNLDISPEARANFLVKQKRLLAEMSKQSEIVDGGMGTEAKMAQLEQYGKLYQSFSKDSERSVKERLDYAEKYAAIEKSIVAMKMAANSTELNIKLGQFDNNNSSGEDLEQLRALQINLYNDISGALSSLKRAQSEINSLKKEETAELTKQRNLINEIANRKAVTTGAKKITPETFKPITPTIKPEIEIPDNLKSKFYTAVSAPMTDLAVNVGEMFSDIIGGGVMLFAEGLGDMINGGGFASVLGGLLDLLKQFGSALIAAGIAGIALKSVFANPWASLAAGVALVATVSVAKSKLQNVANFANGGIVSGETFARVGEYAGANSNPEVIAPLNKLKQLLPKPETSPMGGEVRFEIDGMALVGILKKHYKFNDRI